MTVSNQDPVDRYNGTGAQTSFAITFPFDADTEIQVWLRDESVSPATEAQQTNPADFSVSGTNVDFVSAPAATDVVVIKRLKPFTQTLDLIDGGPVEEEAIEAQLDKMILSQQQLEEKLDRALLMPETTDLSEKFWPEFAGNANKIIGINATGDGIEATTVDVSSLQSQITTNASNIATNVTNIATNAANIATNTANIATNTGNIATNAAAIAANVISINANTANIGTNTTNIADHETRILALEAGTDVVSFSGIQGVQNGGSAQLVELAFDGDDFSSAIIEYEIDRSTDAPDVRFTTGTLYAQFKGGAWRVERGSTVGDADGLNFSIATDGANVGRISYSSDLMPGTANSYRGCIQYKVRQFPIPMSSSQAINNGAGITNITALAFDGDKYSSIIVDYEIDRSTDAPDVRFTTGRLWMQFKNGAWRVERESSVGDADGVVFSVTTDGDNVGQLEYSSDLMPGGSYAGEFKFEFKTFLQPTQVD